VLTRALLAALVYTHATEQFAIHMDVTRICLVYERENNLTVLPGRPTSLANIHGIFLRPKFKQSINHLFK